MVDANVAVLIDYENVGLDAIQRLLDQLSDVGRVVIRRAYGDWSVPVQRGKQDQLLELGIEPIHQYHSNKSGKNSSDIRLAIEAVDLLYSSPFLDTFVIVSSDSDFVPLVGKLRSSGKSVIVAGRREATSPTLIKSCDRYIFLDTEKRAPQQTGQQSRRRTTRRNGNQTAQTGNAEANAQALLLRAMDVSMDETGQVVGSKLYQTMRRIEPSFNFRDLRHRLFTQFLEAHTDVVEITRPREGGGDVVVQLANREQTTPPPIKPPPVRADNENRAAKLVDPRDTRNIEPDIPATRDADEKPQPARSQATRRQSESRPQPRRRLLGSTRPAARQPQPEAVEDTPAEDKPEVALADAAASTRESTQTALAQAKPEATKPEPAEPKQEQPAEDKEGAKDATPNISWEVAVDAAWQGRDVPKIAGRLAATDAAKILGAPKLGASQYPTLDKLLSASTLLQLNWRREGNAIFRK